MTRKHYTKLILSISLLLVIILILIFYIVIENNKTPISYNYLTFPNTDWGMTKEECLKSLNLSEKDIDYVDSTHQSEIFNVNCDIFGYSAKVTYCFKNVLYDSSNNLSLYQVNVEFLKEVNINDIKDKLLSQIESQNVDYFEDNDVTQLEGIISCYSSKFKIKSLKNKQIEEKAKKVMNSKNGDRYYNNVPLSGIALSYSKDEDYYFISYSGYHAALLNNLK